MALDDFDKLQSLYKGIPDALTTSVALIRVTPFMAVEGTTTWTVQTLRIKDIDGQGASGDLVFIEKMDAEGSDRYVLPAKVTDAIARQRDALTFKSRSKSARERSRTTDASHLLTPEVRAKALASRKAKAAKRAKRKR